MAWNTKAGIVRRLTNRRVPLRWRFAYGSKYSKAEADHVAAAIIKAKKRK